MSRPFRDKNKDLVKLEVVTADFVWTTDKNGKPKLRQVHRQSDVWKLKR